MGSEEAAIPDSTRPSTTVHETVVLQIPSTPTCPLYWFIPLPRLIPSEFQVVLPKRHDD
ncbi:hypothetical protein D9758_016580 [Tetrapyrgos nigripes]|uniref:Uncharacterized protein n=1 Tax=Tetrapyrgos nigripes TaxID=182062 RepID=A0A8H5C212_9AGAR|nr:hypothetical protein D9758_016580 [Tetrapyrgos nigripes]